jgi:hypothetical protein
MVASKHHRTRQSYFVFESSLSLKFCVRFVISLTMLFLSTGPSVADVYFCLFDWIAAVSTLLSEVFSGEIIFAELFGLRLILGGNVKICFCIYKLTSLSHFIFSSGFLIFPYTIL